MYETVANKWLAALRSGEYKQGRGTLHVCKDNQDEYCCLGVLCDLYAKATGSKPEKFDADEEHSHNNISAYYSYHSESFTLPPPVMEWAGMRTNTGVVKYDKHLAALNDEYRLSFLELANIIEDNIERL